MLIYDFQTFTTNSSFDSKTNKIVPKLTLKAEGPSGFVLEKFELSSDCKTTVETSLSDVAPGLKFEFKGNEGDKAELSFKYVIPNATFTGDFDINSFSNVKASANAAHGAFTGGASADVKIAKSAVESTTVAIGAGYTQPSFFVGARANKNFGDFSALFSYFVNNKATVAGVINHNAKGPNATLATVYKCCPLTTIKVKANTCGVFSASVKRAFEKKFSVVGSVEVPSDLNTFKFGVNATLG